MVGLLALFAAIIVVRSAAVTAFADNDASKAATIWPGHPTIRLRTGLAQIGELAASGQAVAQAQIAPLLAAARRAPLAPEPFLVRGVELRLAGDEGSAGKAFAKARERDPRSVPARFFLADHYLRTNAIEAGLGEVAALTLLVPGSEVRLAPVLAGYAQTPGAAPAVRAMLRTYPRLESGLLALLSAEARNVELIEYLASDRREADGSRPGWQARMVETLVTDGQFERAFTFWAKYHGLPADQAARPPLFDRQFQFRDLARPFGWTLASGGAALVERMKGGLHVIYYGREAVTLASQTTLLRPGPHVFTVKVDGGGADLGSLAWSVACLPGGQRIFTIDLATARTRAGLPHRFAVPSAGCGAQRLELRGSPAASSATIDVSMTGIDLFPEDRQ